MDWQWRHRIFLPRLRLRRGAIQHQSKGRKTMLDPNFILLYVDSPANSATFYQKLLGRPPVESSPNFAMFPLREGMLLGLWARTDVQPDAPFTGGGAEIGFPVASDTELMALRDAWKAIGAMVIQEPTNLDFGFTFVATDPDGHRLRAFRPSATATSSAAEMERRELV
jgi:predicted enzyme related to lactoylglutathione lyase